VRLSRSIFFPAVVILAFMASLARGFRWELNDFARAHWLLTYDYFFVKRGLAGSILEALMSSIGQSVTYRNVVLSSWVAFVVSVLALLFLLLDFMKSHEFSVDSFILALLFSASPFVGYHAHLIGYLDHILILIFVVALLFMRRGWVFWGWIFISLAVLIHENAILWLAPLYAGCSLSVLRSGERVRCSMVCGGAIVLVVFLLVSVNQVGLASSGFIVRYRVTLALSGFVSRDAVEAIPNTLALPFYNFFASQWRQFPSRLFSFECMLLALPAISIFLYALLRSVGLRLFVPSLLACFSPQLLHLVAFDTQRIWFFSLFSAFVLLIHLTRRRVLLVGERGTFYSLVTLWLCVVLPLPLMDELVENMNLPQRMVIFGALYLVVIFSLFRIGRADIFAPKVQFKIRSDW
jgi:hypothetical protein